MLFLAAGTGKTYVGLRIVQTLLANACPLPILYICRTNQGLDRFHAGISKFCYKNELFRIGASDDIAAARQAKIIAMTTTDAANNNYRRFIETIIDMGMAPKIMSKHLK